MVRTNKHTRYRGLEAVESAIIFPVLLLFVMGGIRFGWLFLQDQYITNAARHGARMAILPGKTTAEVEQMIIEILDDDGITITADDIDFEPDDISSVGSGDTLTVTVTVDVNSIDIITIPVLTEREGDWAIGASVTMAKEGPSVVIP